MESVELVELVELELVLVLNSICTDNYIRCYLSDKHLTLDTVEVQ